MGAPGTSQRSARGPGGLTGPGPAVCPSARGLLGWGGVSRVHAALPEAQSFPPSHFRKKGRGRNDGGRGGRHGERQRASALPCRDPTLLWREGAPLGTRGLVRRVEGRPPWPYVKATLPPQRHSTALPLGQPGSGEARRLAPGPQKSGADGGLSQGPGWSCALAGPSVSRCSGQGGPHSPFPPVLLAALLQLLFNRPPPALAKPRGARWVTASPGSLPGENSKGRHSPHHRVRASLVEAWGQPREPASERQRQSNGRAPNRSLLPRLTW